MTDNVSLVMCGQLNNRLIELNFELVLRTKKIKRILKFAVRNFEIELV